MNYFKADTAIVNNASIGSGTKIWHYANAYGCSMGENCIIGAYTEIQNDVHIGNNVTISSHSFICSLVEIDGRFRAQGLKAACQLGGGLGCAQLHGFVTPVLRRMPP